MMRFPVRLLSWMGVLACFVGAATAQRGPDERPKLSSVSGEGKVLLATPALLQVQSTKDGEVWLLQPGGPTAEMTYTATAVKSWLAPKMFVRLEAAFDRLWVVADPATAIEEEESPY